MGAIIGFSAWLGNYFDDLAQNSTKWYTIALSLFGVFAATYLTLKEFMKKKT